MLDGFDELLEERPDEARKNLRELIETLHGAGRVMVTARSTFFRTSTDVADFLEHGVSADDVTIVDLKPFDAAQRAQLVSNLAPDQRTINYINQILEMEGMGEAMGSPLLLKETIEALKDAQVRKRLSTKTKRSDLFTVLEASVYQRERLRHGHRFSDKVQQHFVEGAAEEMLRANARGFDVDSIHVLALEAAAAFDFEAPESDFGQLADHHFLTVDHASDVVRFNHQVFREYFQAKALLRASQNGGEQWVRSVLQQRPLPEEVARFVAEVSGSDNAFIALCERLGDVLVGGHLARNLAVLCEAYGTKRALDALLAKVDASVGLTLSLRGVDLNGYDFGTRMFERLELVDSDASAAKFDNTVIRELQLSGTSLDGARFTPGYPEILQLNYGTREFEPGQIQAALSELGGTGFEQDEEQTSSARFAWRDHVRDLIVSRLRRFHSGVAGASYLWDSSISEKNFFGGLDQVDRLTTSQALLPELVRKGVLTKHREHNAVVYRLTDRGKTDGYALLAQGEVSGALEEVLEEIAPRGENA